MKPKSIVFAFVALICALLSRIPATAQALPIIPEENRPVIAIWNTGPKIQDLGMEEKSSVLSTLLATEFGKQADQQVTIVNRENLDEHLKEMVMALDGRVDPKNAAEVGKLIGAKYAIIATITRFASKDIPLNEPDPWRRPPANGEDLITSKLSTIKIKRATFSGRLDVHIYDVETGILLVADYDEEKTRKIRVQIARIGNKARFDDRMVSEFFEPTVKRITPKITKRLIDKLGLTPAAANKQGVKA